MSTPNGDPPAPQSGQNGGGTATPQYITKEALEAFQGTMLEALKAEIGKSVNAAAKAQAERQLKAMGLTPDVLAKLKPSEEPQASDDEEGKGRKRPETTPEPKVQGPPDVLALEKRFQEQLQAQKAEFDKKLAAADKKATEERKAREDAERRRVEQQGFTAARELIATEVKQGAAGAVLDILRARGTVIVAEDGQPYFKGASAEDDPRPFKDGLGDFLKTAEGQLFVPPPQVPRGGNGGTRPLLPLTGNGAGGQGPNIDRNFEAQTGQSLHGALFK